MSTTVPSRNGDARGASDASTLLPDESALRHVFDDEFPSLVGQARVELGEAAQLAPKVVESAFVHAWEQRSRFEDPKGLRAFLHDDVHHGVARTLSRRAAAHRLGHHAPGDDHTGAALPPLAADAPPAPLSREEVEAAWRHVVETLHDHGPSLAARTSAIEASRHDAAQHVAQIARPRSWWKPAVVALLGIAAIAWAMTWADSAAQQSAITRALSAADTRLASAGRGQQAVVTLAEGTRVKLFPDTRVTIPKAFDVDMRAVKVDGAATFEPRNGLEHPFQVHVRNAIVFATGTSFAVRAFEKDPGVTVLVTDGTVSVQVGSASRPVAKGEALFVAQDGTMRTPTAEELRIAMAWTRDYLAYTGPLSGALPELERWFNLDITPEHPSLGERPVTLDVPLASPKLAIEAIEAQAKVKYSYGEKSRDLLFRDAAAPAKK